MSTRFLINLDQLAGTIQQIDQFDRHLLDALNEVDARVNRLHTKWSGDAAQAHRAAHQKWQDGAEKMRAGLAEMRRNAEIARGNYREAVETNLSMWEQAR